MPPRRHRKTKRHSKTKPFYQWNVVTALMLVLLLLQLVLMFAGGLPKVFWYYENFGLSWDGISHGKVWQLLSYALLHGDWFHLLINLLILWFAGGRVVQMLGQRKSLEIIVVGVLVGGLLHLLSSLLRVTGYGESYLVGISGACFALLLALTTLSPHTRMGFIPVSGKNLGLGIVIGETLLWLMHPSLSLPVLSSLGEQMVAWGGAALFEISHACHLGGALAGWCLARRVLAPVCAST
jgi:membrane associated rhomboid family serine protease